MVDTINVPDFSGASVTVPVLPPKGQAVAASSLPVVLASDQGGLAVTGPLTATQLGTAALATHADIVALITALGTPAQAGVTVAVSGPLTNTQLVAATLTTKQAPYTAAAAITPGTPVTAGRAVLIACTAAGNQSLKLSGGTTISVPVTVGASVLDNFAITDAPTSGTTATATVTVLS